MSVLNPDQELLQRFRNEGPMPFDTNPLAAALGAELLQLDRAAARIEMRFTPTSDFGQADGSLHAGTIASMLDFAMGFSALAAVQHPQSIAAATATQVILRG